MIFKPVPLHRSYKESKSVKLTYCDAGVRVGSLNQLFALVSHHPVGINLSGSLWIQVDHLELPEVCNADGIVLWTHIQYVWNTVIVKVVFAGVSSSIACSYKREINRLNLAQSSFFCYKPYFPKCGELLLVH